jgi:hypothetical protein
MTALLAVAEERLGDQRVHAVTAIPWDDLHAEDAVLVLHPERDLHYREVTAFLSAGGRLGLLDDFGRGDALLEKFRIRRVQAPLRPLETLANNPALAVAVPSGSDHARHPVVAGVDRLVTNHPTGLRTQEGVHLTPVLDIPGIGETDTLLAVIGVIGDAQACGLADESRPSASSSSARCGRLFAMGDPSAVMNLMMRYPGNRAFAAGLVDYLTADDTWGKRKGRLFVVANEFEQHGAFGGGSGLERTLSDRLEAAEDFVQDIHHDGLPGPLAVLLAAMTTLAAAWFIARVSTRPYARPEPRYARPTPLVLQGGVAGRAAVLAAPTTSRALAVIEMKSALEEALREALGLEPSVPLDEAQRVATERGGLSRKQASELDALLREMQAAELAVATSRRIRVTPASLARMKRKMSDLLAALDRSREPR